MRLAVHLQRNLDVHVLVLLVLMSSFVETRAVPEGRHGPTSARTYSTERFPGPPGWVSWPYPACPGHKNDQNSTPPRHDLVV